MSFKEREKDLYNYVMQKKSPSAYLKELVDADRQKKDTPKERPQILDF